MSGIRNVVSTAGITVLFRHRIQWPIDFTAQIIRLTGLALHVILILPCLDGLYQERFNNTI
jgi:hypothetical protein